MGIDCTDDGVLDEVFSDMVKGQAPPLRTAKTLKDLAEDVARQRTNSAFSATLCPMEYDLQVDDEILMAEEVDFDVALDSGCVEHVCAQIDVPGHVPEPSEASRRGAKFIVGNGERVPNEGQVHVKMHEAGDAEVNTISSTFQIAKVTRPLMSVSKICDSGLTATFDKDKAVIRDSSGKVVCTFKRHGGPYVCRMRLKTPFRRQH